MAEKQIVVFSLGQEEFAIEISMVREIVRMQAIRPIPGLDSFIEGIVHLRGTIIPVVDLGKKFSLESGQIERDRAKIVMVNQKNKQIGIIVDDVNEILRISEDSIDPSPEIIGGSMEQKYITGVAKEGERLIIILDVDRIFSSEEKDELEEVVVEEKEQEQVVNCDN